ncbi:hypothetical protein [Streptomyces albipurpureus]|uniref:Uncharacterized protein n=1 Tax=Streptomyces albipurpureus TaxID=2897419 RepID=A0ABT0UXY5_9ACTN|nr:hypothetical protein [Streptomyces sp. CWNU-1]MCM2392814.1 hypothetical protein [Streptomyces sp. CWNU-1]
MVAFLPDWMEIPLLCLVLLIFAVRWAIWIKDRIEQRRMASGGGSASGHPLAAAPGTRGSGADHPGAQAPSRPEQGPSGADFPGSYAPQRDAESGQR